MNKINYALRMGEIIVRHGNAGETPRLLLHSCCAPCSSSTLEQLTDHFLVAVYYYNPNIFPEKEYRRRADEQIRFLGEIRPKNPVSFIEGEYHPECFRRISVGLEQEPEGGARCTACYELRLRSAGEAARAGGFDYFSTTLSVSPHKDAARLNEIGGRLAEEYGVPYLFSDFKKRNGYLRSIRLAQEYGLYRQEYCGCQFSLENVSRK